MTKPKRSARQRPSAGTSPRGPFPFSKILVSAALALTFLLLLFSWNTRRENFIWVARGESPGDYFGTKVAPAGDVNGDGFADVSVWAQGYGGFAGKVYVFMGSRQGLSKTPAWGVQGEKKNDQYGHSFGATGDVNGDGFGDFIVAAQAYDAPGAIDIGKAYLYLGSSAGLSKTASWAKVGYAPRELFGDCSGRAGDIDHDGLSDVIIGAYGHAAFKGRAYLFNGSRTGALLEEPSWTGQGEAANDWYGYSVAPAGDVNGDGQADVIIGAKQVRDGAHINVGKVYVYYGSSKDLPKDPSWTAKGERASDLFGWRALSAGDTDSDGYDDVFVCSYMHDSPDAVDCGKVYLYRGSAEGLSREPSWTKTGERAGALFGISIGSGDFNKDGYSDVLVGSPNSQRQFGAVHLFQGSKQGLSNSPTWTGTGENIEGRFGTYVANAGDVNGDGYPDVIVGAPYDPEKGEKSGKAYLFYGNKTGKLRTYP